MYDPFTTRLSGTIAAASHGRREEEDDEDDEDEVAGAGTSLAACDALVAKPALSHEPRPAFSPAPAAAHISLLDPSVVCHPARADDTTTTTTPTDAANAAAAAGSDDGTDLFTVFVPTMFTTAHGRPVCIREKRRLPRDCAYVRFLTGPSPSAQPRGALVFAADDDDDTARYGDDDDDGDAGTRRGSRRARYEDDGVEEEQHRNHCCDTGGSKAAAAAAGGVGVAPGADAAPQTLQRPDWQWRPQTVSDAVVVFAAAAASHDDAKGNEEDEQGADAGNHTTLNHSHRTQSVLPAVPHGSIRVLPAEHAATDITTTNAFAPADARTVIDCREADARPAPTGHINAHHMYSGFTWANGGMVFLSHPPSLPP